MKTLHLNPWERYQLKVFVEGQQGDIGQLRKYMRLLDILEMSDENKAACQFEEDDNGRITDPGDLEHLFELTMDDADLELLWEKATKHQAWIARRDVMAMLEKLDEAKSQKHPRKKKDK